MLFRSLAPVQPWLFQTLVTSRDSDAFVRVAITDPGTLSRNAQLGINDLYTGGWQRLATNTKGVKGGCIKIYICFISRV